MGAVPRERPPVDREEPPPSGQTTTSGSPGAGQAPPPRSKAEKFIIRVLAAALIVFLAVEGRARFGYELTLGAVAAAFSDENQQRRTKLSELEPKFALFPGRVREVRNGQQVVRLTWFSFVARDQYEIELTVDGMDDDAALLSFMTPDAARVDPFTPAKPANTLVEDLSHDPLLSMAVPEVGDYLDWMSGLDRNRDGRLTRDEWTEIGMQLLTRADQNCDDVVTRPELTRAARAVVEARRAREKPRQSSSAVPGADTPAFRGDPGARDEMQHKQD